MSAKWIYLFWGVLDLFYVGRFLYVGYSQDKVPLYTDLQSFILLSAEQSNASLLMFALSVLLNLSIVLSAVLLLCRHRSARYLVYAQTPLRVALAVPSLSFLPWLIQAGEINAIALLAGLLIFSEMLKVACLVFGKKPASLRFRSK